MNPEYVWFFDPDNGKVRTARLISRGAHASQIEYRVNGLDWRVLVSNDDIEYIGDDKFDNED